MGTAKRRDGNDDTLLIALALDGDRRAFGRLIRGHDPAMRRLATRLTDSPAAMDDVLQEAYLKAFCGLESFDHRSTFATWLYSITYRTAIDHHRRARIRRASPLDDEIVSRTTASSSDAMMSGIVDRSLLRKALSELPPEQAATMVLVDGEGLSYQETAEILGIATGTVASRVNRARSALRNVLGSMDGGT